MTRLRWAGGIALIALATTACGMGGGDDNGQSGEEAAPATGTSSTPTVHAPAAAWALETDDAHALTRAGCLETLSGTTTTARSSRCWPRRGTRSSRRPGSSPCARASSSRTARRWTPRRSPARSPTCWRRRRRRGRSTPTSCPAWRPSTRRPCGSPPRAGPARPAAAGQPEHRHPRSQGVRRRQIDIQGTCTGPFTVTDERRGSRSRSSATRTTGVARSASRPPRCASSSTVPPGPPSCRPVRRISPGLSRRPTSAAGGRRERRDPRAAGPAHHVDAAEQHPLPPSTTRSCARRSSTPIDTQAIAEGVYEGTGAPAVGPFVPTTRGRPRGPSPSRSTRTRRASLLEEAGVDPESLSSS